MAIGDDFQIDVTGNIRYTGSATNYTVIALHRWLGDLMDDAQAAGNDILDITDATASARSTDNIVQLNSPYNIDDIAAQHLYDGSIVQSNGDEIYDGILVFAQAGTPLQIIQAGKPVGPNFWDTALNPDSTAGISHRFMVKVRTAGVDIDLRKLLGQTREVGFSYTEFPTTTVRGNNVLALTHSADLNNATAEATIRGWTTVSNTEGYRLLDVNNDTTNEPYYSEWNLGTQSINDFYERHKWLHRESTIEDSTADTGADLQLGNATIIGQAQSWQNGVNAQYVTRVRVKMKKLGTPTGAITCTIESTSGAFGTASIPSGTTHATADNTVEAGDLTTAYLTYEFKFNTPFEVLASTNYEVTFEKAVGDGSNHVLIDGDLTGTHAGNRASLVTVTWTPAAAEDINFEVYASPKQYLLPGEVFRGVTHQVELTGATTGTFNAVEEVSWGTGGTAGTGQMLAINSPTAGTRMWIQLLTGVAPGLTLTITGTDSGASVSSHGSTAALARTVSAPSVGLSTGSAIVGAYGLGIETADITNADKLTDLDDTLRLPPNNVTFTVSGLVTTVDRVLVAPLGFSFAYDNEASGPFAVGDTLTFTTPAGTAYLSELIDDGTTGRMNCRLLTGSNPQDNSTIANGGSATADVFGAVANSEDTRQLKLATTLVGATETAVVSVDVIPTDTPNSGTIRIQLNTGVYRLQAYTSYTGSTFTIASTDYSGVLTATGGAGETGNSMYISYLDLAATGTQESFTGVYLANRNLFIRVRDGVVDANGPIKTFETTGVLTTAGGSATAIRTPDS